MTSAEEAVARAKAIAARLAGTAASAAIDPEPINGGTSSTAISSDAVHANAVADAAIAAAFGQISDLASSGTKRKRWGEESSGVASEGGVISSEDALAQALNVKRLNTGTVTKKLKIPVEEYPGYNFIGLLIGPGGSKQRELIAEAGGNVKISIRGKGSSSSNANPHLPEEPLHVFLEGNEENVEKAEALIMPLLNDPEKAQAEKDKQLAVVGSTKEGVSTYKPKPVAELLGLSGGHYGPGVGDEVIEEKIGIPNGFVGYIIGKGGESITNMQRKSGCRVQIQKEHEMEPGTTQRIITLTGATPEAVRMCRSIIEEMVQERARLNGHRTGGILSAQGPVANAAGQAAQLQKALSEGQVHVTVQVPNSDVGLIIGKGGATIKSIQERSSANVQIPQTPDHDNPSVRTINITHPNKEGAEFAKTLIEEVLSAKQNQGVGMGYVPSAVGGISVQIHIPDQDVGMCIGKSGCVIRELQMRTQTKIQIPSQPVPGQIYRIATVTGPPEGCQKVQEIIARISAEQSSQFVMTGEVFNQYGQQMYGQLGHGQYMQQQQQQQQQQQYGGQQAVDYSAQWAAYYAAQSAVQTNGGATQSTAAASTPAPAAGQQVAADQYYEDFFRYSYYYGEEAARQQYGAWAPPEGTPNPYGVNPNLSTTAASAGASTPSTVAATSGSSVVSSAVADVKDSSVRKGVSNLPAWMTKNE